MPQYNALSLNIVDVLAISVREVEVIVSVVVILTLAEAGEDEVEGDWHPREPHPNAEAEIDNPSLNEELVGTAIHEMEEPLLCSVRSVVPDISSGVTRLLIKVFLAIPSTVLHLGNSETFAIDESHILHVAMLIVSQSASRGVHFY